MSEFPHTHAHRLSDALPAAEANPLPPRKKSRQREVAALLEFASGLQRVVTLQLKIWLTRAKQMAVRLIIIAVLSAISIFLALMAAIFFYVGSYRFLTDVLHLNHAWACLIFAGVHLLVIGILMAVVMLMLRRSRRSDV